MAAARRVAEAVASAVAVCEAARALRVRWMVLICGGSGCLCVTMGISESVSVREGDSRGVGEK